MCNVLGLSQKSLLQTESHNTELVSKDGAASALVVSRLYLTFTIHYISLSLKLKINEKIHKFS